MTAALLASALFGPLCAPCHGAGGRGDGPAAHLNVHPPADLTAPSRLGDSRDAIRRALTTGAPPMGMPSFAALSGADLDALTDHVLALRGGGGGPTPSPDVNRANDDWWPPGPQGARPRGAVYDLGARKCAVCHPTQHAAWRTSRHGRAMGPGVTGQLHGAKPAFVRECDGCHAPLAEQRPQTPLRDEGVTCAACHLRQFRKHGPPKPKSGRLAAHALVAAPVERFARSDFCLPCHNLPLTVAVKGRPLLDTWREWAASPYLVAGVQCQHCHQPDGDHGFRGAHDLEMARSAIRLEVGAPIESKGVVSLDIVIHNSGAGHHFPTTATPKAVLAVRQLRGDQPVFATVREWPIARAVEFGKGGWRELADTRIPAGGALRRRYQVRRAEGVTALQLSVRLMPDAFYSGFFESRLSAGGLGAEVREAYEAALTESRAVLWLHTARVPL